MYAVWRQRKRWQCLKVSDTSSKIVYAVLQQYSVIFLKRIFLKRKGLQ